MGGEKFETTQPETYLFGENADLNFLGNRPTPVSQRECSILSLSYISSYMHARPGYREKLANLQGTLKLHMRFYNRILRLQRPPNENWHAHYSLRACSMATKASMYP